MELEVYHSFLLLGHGVVGWLESDCMPTAIVDQKLMSMLVEDGKKTRWIGKNVFGISSL